MAKRINADNMADLLSDFDNLHQYDDVEADFFGDRLEETVISIMIPTYKRMDFLYKAISSALNQDTDIQYEVVVVDNDNNNSDDIIHELLQYFDNPKLSYYRNKKNIGMFGNWNRCISYARGNWIIILNDDDEIGNNYLSCMSNYMDKIKGCGAISCQHNLIDYNDKIIGHDWIDTGNNYHLIPILMKDFYFFHPINIYGCLFRKDLAIRIGGFDENFYPCSDAVFLMRLCNLSKVFLCTGRLFNYRWAVNESLKKETQVEFEKFNLLKAYQLNKAYNFWKLNMDSFIRNCMCDSLVYVLKEKKALSYDEAKMFRRDVCCDERYRHFRRFIARVVNRLYRYSFKCRKIKF